MSRIIFALINSAITPKLDEYFLFHSNTHHDAEIIDALGIKCWSLEENKFNKKISVIKESDISNNLSLRPKFIVNSDIIKYESAQNLSDILRVPLYNIFYKIKGPIRKEAVLLLTQRINSNVNIIFSKDMINNLFLTNYRLTDNVQNIKQIISEEYSKWKPI